MTKSEKCDPEKSAPSQSKITRFLPARKAREQAAKQLGSTPVSGSKRSRGGLASSNSPDIIQTSEEEQIAEAKSPEHKKTRPHSESLEVKEYKIESTQPPTSIQAVPAYQRFAHLLGNDLDSADQLSRPHLPLPSRYSLILKLQQALDSAISIAAGRGQRPVWHRLLTSLQASTGRTLTMDHLRLLCAFLPNTYALEPCKIIDKGRRIDSMFIDIQETLGHRERRDILHAALLSHVLLEHAKFLESINISLPENAELRNWHPKFKLEDILDPPLLLLDKVEVVTSDRGTVVPDIIKQAIESVCLPSDTNKLEDDKSSDNPPQEKPPKLSLRDRIRLKEQQAELEKMLGPSSSKWKKILASLPDLIDTLSFMFATAKKTVLFLSAVQERLRQSCNNPWSNEELDERLDALHKLLPDWITISRAENPYTVRIEKSMSPKALKERLAASTKQ